MKRFIVKILLFVGIPSLSMILAIIFAIVLPPETKVPSSYASAYLAAGKQKDILLATVESPRIILVGGSSAAFGLDSQIIKDSLGLNPINVGLHAGLGLKYMLDNTYQYIKEGDIVVVAPEYIHFYLTYNWVSEELVQTFIKVDKQKIKLINITLIKNSLPYIATMTSKSLRNIISTSAVEPIIYKALKFNEYGDYYGHWGVDYPDFSPYELDITSYNQKVMRALRNFEKKIHKKGAMLYVSYPPYEGESFDLCIKSIKKIEQEYMRYGFALLGTPERYRMERSLMSNTPYHLNKNGAALRTELLIEDLKVAGIGRKI